MTQARETAEITNTFSKKNYIVNPTPAISQENGDGPNVITTDFYVADQWFSQNTAGGTITAERGSLAGFRSIKLTATSGVTDLSGSNTAGRFNQKLEAQNVFHLNGKNTAQSFIVNTNWSGKLPIAIRAGDNSKSYVVDVDVTSGINVVQANILFDSDVIAANDNTTGFWVVIGGNNEGSFRTSNPESWESGILFCTTDSTQWTKTTGNFVEITAVKLEEGSVASAFEPNSYAYDLAECQRYFERLEYEPNAIISMGQALSSSLVRGLVRFSEKRDPASTVVSVDGDITNTAASGGDNASTISIGVLGNKIARVEGTTSGMSAGNASSFEADGAVSIFINSRL